MTPFAADGTLEVTGRALAGLLLAGAIAVTARRARALAPSGAVAATVVGAVCAAAGWAWAALLIGFFVASTALSRYGAARKDALTASVVEKGGERDAAQVAANGALFAVAAVLSLTAPSPGWEVAGAGALAAAAADTWATEVGTLAGGRPRSILSGRALPPGTSGGVTVVGTAASVAGAAFVGALALLLGWPRAAAGGALVGGFVGALADSLLGATIQARRRCPHCGVATERRLHVCGTPTTRAGGLRWLDNDAVNALATAVGAGTAVLAGRIIAA